MTRFLLTLVLAFATAYAALADGVQRSGRIASSEPAPVDSRTWTGPYIGVGIGYRAAELDTSLDIAKVGSLLDSQFAATGMAYDGRLGGDFQLPNSKIVVGAFVGLPYGDAEHSLNSALGGFNVWTAKLDPKFYAGARVGLSLWNNSTLAYVGYKWTRADLDVSLLNGAANVSREIDAHGALVGIEHKLAQSGFRLALEYGIDKYETTNLCNAGCGPFAVNVKTTEQTGMVRLNYGF